MYILKYRSEIDRLRAVAVFSVILFHANPALLPGGFLGVDIFFVISGYVISSIILREYDLGSFRYSDFYNRRAKRLLPALILVCIGCMPCAWFWMMHAQLKGFGQSLVAVALFASNFLFWVASDYFALAAEERPLLHTWSLGVEQQFYLFFSFVFLALLIAAPAVRRWVALLVCLWCTLILLSSKVWNS